MGFDMTDSSDSIGRRQEERTTEGRSRRPAYLGGRPGRALPDTVAGKPETTASDDRGKPEKPEEDALKQSETDNVIYSWKVWLFKRRPLVSAVVVVTVVGSILLAYWAFPQVLFIGVITVLMLNRLAPYLFPVKYTLNERTVGYRTFLAKDIREWSTLRTYREFPDGVLLSHDTTSVRGRLKETLFLYYYEDCSNKDDVLKVIRDKVVPFVPEPKGDDGRTHKGGFRSALRRVRGIKESSKSPPGA